uniref:Uncharacterized protein n=1 Tax=Anguilla anguilla TaxID=7936 RepID=A0A0E9UHE8_ANGAN
MISEGGWRQALTSSEGWG